MNSDEVFMLAAQIALLALVLGLSWGAGAIYGMGLRCAEVLA